MINRAQGMQIVLTAKASGEWTYSQGEVGKGRSEPPIDYARRVGDCTDYCRNAVASTLGALWAGGPKANTTAFLEGRAAGFTEVEASAAQPGDIVVSGGHAGVFTGVNSKGEVRGLANNGSPMSAGYRDRETRVITFKDDARFFRALAQEER